MTYECFSVSECNLIACVKSMRLPPPLSKSRVTHYLRMCPEGHPSEMDLKCAINIPSASLCHANWCRGDFTIDAKSIHNCSFTLNSYFCFDPITLWPPWVFLLFLLLLPSTSIWGFYFIAVSSIPFTALFRLLYTIKLHIHGCFTYWILFPPPPPHKK